MHARLLNGSTDTRSIDAGTIRVIALTAL